MPVLIIIIILLLLAVAGVCVFLLMNKDDDDGGAGGSSSRSARDSSSYSIKETEEETEETEEDTEEETEMETETELPAETEPESDEVVVPDLSGLSYVESVHKAEEAGLTIYPEPIFTYDDEVPEGNVVRQNLEPGTVVAKGEMIMIVYSRGPMPTEGPAATEPETETEAGTQPVQTQPTTEKAEEVLRKGKVMTKETDLNIRKSASSNSDIIGSAAKGGTVDIVGEEGSWYKIKYKDGYGYVAKEYISIVN